jgi:hypothetical protein
MHLVTQSNIINRRQRSEMLEKFLACIHFANISDSKIYAMRRDQKLARMK